MEKHTRGEVRLLSASVLAIGSGSVSCLVEGGVVWGWAGAQAQSELAG